MSRRLVNARLHAHAFRRGGKEMSPAHRRAWVRNTRALADRFGVGQQHAARRLRDDGTVRPRHAHPVKPWAFGL